MIEILFQQAEILLQYCGLVAGGIVPTDAHPKSPASRIVVSHLEKSPQFSTRDFQDNFGVRPCAIPSTTWDLPLAAQ